MLGSCEIMIEVVSLHLVTRKGSSISCMNNSWTRILYCQLDGLPNCYIRYISHIIKLIFIVLFSNWTFLYVSLVLVLWQTLEGIKKENKDAQLKVFEVDLSSFQSILKFKSSFEKWLSDSFLHSSIQLLINNAGMLATSHHLTVEGYDQ